ncbi:MAG TPA: hypothetical protein VK130_10460 [Steroidobacteraceae bacterium]|nr:hypothetical protein [Steroidobacteraceae bacterium]
MSRNAACGLLFVALLAACSHARPIAPATQPPATTVAPNPVPAPAAAQAPAVPPMAPPAAAVASAPAPAAVPGKKPADNAVATRSPAPSRPPAAPPPRPAAAAATPAPPAPPAPPALNLASLEQRLRDTHAIGVFTKLSLKNQVDDLLDQFRALYRGEVAIPLTALRQRYDLLMLKVLSLLQDSDPPLASDIVASREAIWGILRDPAKFATIS